MDIDCYEMDPDAVRLAHQRRSQPTQAITSVSQTRLSP